MGNLHYTSQIFTLCIKKVFLVFPAAWQGLETTFRPTRQELKCKENIFFITVTDKINNENIEGKVAAYGSFGAKDSKCS